MAKEIEQAQISVLEFPDCVRKRKGMYLTSPDQCVFEIVDNAVDEFAAGRCNKIEVKISNEQVSISDNGGGIPITPSKDPGYEGKPQAEVAMTVLHAGGKFLSAGKEGAYKTSTGGMNGVGASCVNAVSTDFKLEIKTDGKKYGLDFKKGITVKPLYEIGTIPKKDHGTVVSFTLDKEIWNSEWYDFGHIRKRLKQLAYLNPGLSIMISFDTHDAEGKAVKFEGEYNFPEGLTGYINEIIENKERLNEPELITGKIEHSKNKQISVDACFVYTTDYSSDIRSFVNNVGTEYGGDHENGFRLGIADAVKKYALENKMVKDAKALTNDDCVEGMQAIISVKLLDPNFEGQGKGKLRMPEVKTVIKKFIEEQTYDFLMKNYDRSKTIIEKTLLAAKAREDARKARNAARASKAVSVGGNVPDLASCSSKKPEECEIYLVEGDSAGGSAKQARDRKYQAILPIFGKILNAGKATFEKVIDSGKLADMVKALGCGIGKEFNMEKLRYHKIILMADADSDGAHIQCLHMTNFYKTMKPLIEAGYVYAACPPLYKVSRKKGKKEEVTYLYTADELKEFNTENATVQRYKGLGEMSPEQLWDTTMNPETRKLIQIQLNEENAEDTEDTVELLMGKDTNQRREFLLEYL